MTDSRRDARRIVVTCLVEAAEGDDPAKAAAARAELLYRHRKLVENVTETMNATIRKVMEDFGPIVQNVFERMRRFSMAIQQEEHDEAST